MAYSISSLLEHPNITGEIRESQIGDENKNPNSGNGGFMQAKKINKTNIETTHD